MATYKLERDDRVQPTVAQRRLKYGDPIGFEKDPSGVLLAVAGDERIPLQQPGRYAWSWSDRGPYELSRSQAEFQPVQIIVTVMSLGNANVRRPLGSEPIFSSPRPVSFWQMGAEEVSVTVSPHKPSS